MMTDRDVLLRAKERAKLALDKIPTLKNVQRFTAASKALEEFEAKQQVPGAQLTCKTIEESISYLKSRGYKIEKSKFANDAKIGRVIRKDGVYTAAELDRYAKDMHLPKRDTDGEPDDYAESIRLQNKLATERLEREKMRNEQLRGSLIDRDEVERQQAAKLSLFKSGIETTIRSIAAEVVAAAAGNAEHIPDVIDLIIGKLEDHFNEYARPMTFSVAIIAEEKDGEAGNG